MLFKLKKCNYLSPVCNLRYLALLLVYIYSKFKTSIRFFIKWVIEICVQIHLYTFNKTFKKKKKKPLDALTATPQLEGGHDSTTTLKG